MFEVSEKDLVRSTLMLKIQAFDKYSRHHVIGEVQVMLCDVDLVQGIDTWRSIKPSNKVIFISILQYHNIASCLLFVDKINYIAMSYE